MVARHFLSEGEPTALLRHNPGIHVHEARSLYLSVQGKNYSPPRRERILQWQKEQSFPICPILKILIRAMCIKISNSRPRCMNTLRGTMRRKKVQRGSGKMSHRMEVYHALQCPIGVESNLI